MLPRGGEALLVGPVGLVLANELLARHWPAMYVMSSSAVPVTTPGMLTGLLVDGLQPDLKAMAGRFGNPRQEADN